MLRSQSTSPRLLTNRFFYRPYEFLAAQTQLQGDRLVFREPRRDWIVFYDPSDLAEFNQLPRRDVDGGAIKRVIAPWVNDQVLPGMSNSDATSERPVWLRELCHARHTRPYDRIQHCVERVLDDATSGTIDMTDWCSKITTEITQTVFGGSLSERTINTIGSTADPFGTIPPLICRWLTQYEFRKGYRMLMNDLSCLEKGSTREADRIFMMYAGFMVGLGSGLRHLFAEVLRSDPRIRETIREEVVSESDPGQWNYCRAAVDESLRLAPNLVLLVRECINDVHFRGNDIPRGTVIAACPYLTHQRADRYESPDQFDPTRFFRKPQHDRYDYYPFGFGARSCPVNLLARDLMSMVLGEMFRRYDLAIIDARSNPIGFSKCMMVTTRVYHDQVRIARTASRNRRQLFRQTQSCPFSQL